MKIKSSKCFVKLFWNYTGVHVHKQINLTHIRTKFYFKNFVIEETDIANPGFALKNYILLNFYAENVFLLR